MAQLVRGIKRWDLVLLIINSVIGAGIFGLPSRIFNLSGTYSLIAFIVCAIVVIIFILCFAEVSSRFDKTGGPYLYTLSAFGPFPAYVTGWLLLLSRIFNYATLVNLIVIYLSFFSNVFNAPAARIIIIALITALLTYINHVGVKNSARVSNIFTVAKIIPLTVFIIVGLFYLQPELLDFSEAPSTSSFSTSVLLLIFAFGGFESILINSGEISNPRRNLPFALFTGIAVITVFYILIQLVCIGTLPTLATSEKPLAEAAGIFMGQAGGYFIAAGALISIFGTLNALMLGGSRLPYALSIERQFPKALDYVHPKYHTPTRSLILFTLIVAVVSMVWGFLAALTIGAIVRVLVYFMVSASLIQLRRKQPQGDYFKIKGGYVIASVAIIICIWLLSASKLTEIRDVGVCTGVGILVYVLNILFKKNTDAKTDH
jgi:amino acid transporter